MLLSPELDVPDASSLFTVLGGADQLSVGQALVSPYNPLFPADTTGVGLFVAGEPSMQYTTGIVTGQIFVVHVGQQAGGTVQVDYMTGGRSSDLDVFMEGVNPELFAGKHIAVMPPTQPFNATATNPDIGLICTAVAGRYVAVLNRTYNPYGTSRLHSFNIESSASQADTWPDGLHGALDVPTEAE